MDQHYLTVIASSIPNGHLLKGNRRADSLSMEIVEIRRARLRVLLEERFGGSQADLGAAINRAPDILSRMLSGKKTIGEKFARHVESCFSGLPPYWLDMPLDQTAHDTAGDLVKIGAVGRPLDASEIVDVFTTLLASAGADWGVLGLTPNQALVRLRRHRGEVDAGATALPSAQRGEQEEDQRSTIGRRTGSRTQSRIRKS
jgi:hypothetical protein